MPNRPTDHANLDLEALHRDVAFGQAGGMVIWQPRILEWYELRQRTGQGLPAPYTGMSRLDLYRALGCSDRLYDYNDCFECAEDERVEVTQRDLDETDYEITWRTPIGSHSAVYRRSPHTDWHMPVKWPIADEDDMGVAMWRLERMRYRFDPHEYEAMRVRFRGLGAPTIFICRTTIQHLLVSEMGPEATFRMLRRDRGRCEAYFTALTRSQNRLLDLIEASPIEIINYGDNIHATVLSPKLFERYILPVYQTRGSRLRAAGKFVHAHFDGDVKPLLPYLEDTGLSGIEAITPKPQGDVTLEETKAALGDMFLLDGIPAVYFDATYSVETLLDCARRCIDLFAPNLILGISDEMSATGEIERIRLVGEVVDAYNASLSEG
jgi:Uroporphyrinogen decarboxylase (URO-D)